MLYLPALDASIQSRVGNPALRADRGAFLDRRARSRDQASGRRRTCSSRCGASCRQATAGRPIGGPQEPSSPRRFQDIALFRRVRRSPPRARDRRARHRRLHSGSTPPGRFHWQCRGSRRTSADRSRELPQTAPNARRVFDPGGSHVAFVVLERHVEPRIPHHDRCVTAQARRPAHALRDHAPRAGAEPLSTALRTNAPTRRIAYSGLNRSG